MKQKIQAHKEKERAVFGGWLNKLNKEKPAEAGAAKMEVEPVAAVADLSAGAPDKMEVDAAPASAESASA